MTKAGFDNPPNNMIYQLLDGKLPSLLDFGLHFVSIADVATAHVNAMEKPEANGERYLVTNRYIRLKELAEHFRPKYPKVSNVVIATLASTLDPYLANTNEFLIRQRSLAPI